MAKKYYVIWAGHQPGIYDNWATAERQVKGFPGARFKAFPTRIEAEQAYAQGATSAKPKTAPKKSVNKKNTHHDSYQVDVAIYCDGACEGNPGPSGTGIAIYHKGQLHELWYGLHQHQGTNNIAELLGLHHSMLFARQALEAGKNVIIYSDSKYSIDCITTWAYGWKAKGWKKKGGEIKNLELIKAAHGVFEALKGQLAIEHVPGHAGIEGNELADRMSMVAIARKEPELQRFTDALSVTEILSLERG